MASTDSGPPLDPLRGISPQPGTQRDRPDKSCLAALRGANQLALACAWLFTALIGVVAVMALGSGVTVIERLGLIAGAAAAATGFWGIYAMTRYTLVCRQQQLDADEDPAPVETSPRH